jgi:hypothetical protein
MTSPSAIQNSYPCPNEPIWSKSEKAIARKAFDAALGQELQQVIQEVKGTAREIKQSSDLWDLELYLTRRRKEIDRKYDFRGSRLRMSWGGSCAKAGSMRSSCAACGKTNWVSTCGDR